MNFRLPTSRLASLLVIMGLLPSQLPAAAPKSPQIEGQEVKPDADTPAKPKVMRMNADGRTEEVKPSADTPAKPKVMRMNADGRTEEVKPSADTPAKPKVMRMNADGRTEEVKPNTDTPAKNPVIRMNADGKAEEVKSNAVTPAKTAGITLNVGDPAPPIKAARWLKGQPVEAFKKGELYVLEFWATWCGPCKAVMPHLTELAKKYAGKVTFIGMDIWEIEKSPAALDQKLDKFVKGMGEKLGYNVAQDTRDEFMAKAWMKAAGLDGIPQSFIVGKDGRFLWRGHPEALEQTLEAILAGTFKLQDSAAEARQEQERNEARTQAYRVWRTAESPIGNALRAEDWARALKLADETQAKLPSSSPLREKLLPSRIQAQAHLDPAKVQLMLESGPVDGKARDYEVAANALLQIRSLDKRWSELALSCYDKGHALEPNKTFWTSERARFPFLLSTEPAKALALWEAADTDTQKGLAGAIVTLKGVGKPWLDRAIVVLEAKVKGPMGDFYTSALAQGYFELGRIKEAVGAQEKFVAFLKARGFQGEYMLEDGEADLQTYQAALK